MNDDMLFPALRELTDPSNWDEIPQEMEGHDLGYSEFYYVGEFVHREGLAEFESLMGKKTSNPAGGNTGSTQGTGSPPPKPR